MGSRLLAALANMLTSSFRPIKACKASSVRPISSHGARVRQMLSARRVPRAGAKARVGPTSAKRAPHSRCIIAHAGYIMIHRACIMTGAV